MHLDYTLKHYWNIQILFYYFCYSFFIVAAILRFRFTSAMYALITTDFVFLNIMSIAYTVHCICST